MRTRSKRGAAMVEAAIIFPLVAAGVAAVLYIVIALYLSLALQSSLHLALRTESGERSQTVSREYTADVFEYRKEWISLRPAIMTEAEREYQIRSLFRNRISRKESGRVYVIDEAELIRALSVPEGEPD